MIRPQYKKIKGKYKYELTADFQQFTGILGYIGNVGEWVRIEDTGTIYLKKGYRWDGCSGPTIDTITNLRAGLCHDALYQLLRGKVLPQSVLPAVDILFKNICLEDGMSRFRAWYYYYGVNNPIAHLFARPE